MKYRIVDIHPDDAFYDHAEELIGLEGKAEFDEEHYLGYVACGFDVSEEFYEYCKERGRASHFFFAFVKLEEVVDETQRGS